LPDAKPTAKGRNKFFTEGVSDDAPFLLIAIILLMVTAFPSHAQNACGSNRENLVTFLKGAGRAQVAKALTNRGQYFEVYSSVSGNWIAVVTNPNGLICVIGGGTNWERVNPPQIAIGEPS